MIDNDFTKRLKEYRIAEGYYKKAAFANSLRVSDQLYSSVESGYKKPSKDFIAKLVHYSDKSEVYWLYGIEESFINLKNIINSLDKNELIKIGSRKGDKCIMVELQEALLNDILKIGINKKETTAK